MTDHELEQVLTLVAAYWPRWQPNAATIPAAQRMLLDVEFASAVVAVDTLAVEEPRFPPGLGAIRAKALAADDTSAAGEAWRQVQDQIRRVGYVGEVVDTDRRRHREPTFDDPLVGRVVEQLGWKALCESDNEVADRAHFLRLYDAVAERERRRDIAPPSAGELNRGDEPPQVGRGA